MFITGHLLLPILALSLVGKGNSAGLFFGRLSSLCLSKDTSTLTGNGDCKDGVCELPSKASSISTSAAILTKAAVGNDDEDSNESKLSQLVKMGWDEGLANRTLVSANYNLEKAAMLLDDQDKEREEITLLAKELVASGWSEEAAESALSQSGKNITAALLMLEQEESIISANFLAAVKDMVNNGWEEIVARQALLMQWTIDQRKASGMNITIEQHVLDSVRPTLKKKNETSSATQAKKADAKKKSKSDTLASNAPKAPKEAKREDCVFEGSAKDLQKLVMDSDVPVLVDVYADWCGPCKQLGPVLESAAMKSGGMFRLVKINSDKQRELAEVLAVTGLPTVYAFSGGRITDKFVGMLPQDQLQTFIVRLVTGFGERVQADQASEDQLKAMSAGVANFAGLTSLSFQKLSKLKSLVDDVVDCSDALNEEGNMGSALATAARIIRNAHADIRNATVRSVSKTSQTFINKIAPSASALLLLDVAGFKESNSSPGSLVLVHKNVAILSVISQRLSETIQKRKSDKILRKDSSSNNPPPSKKMKYGLKNPVTGKESDESKV